MRSKRAMRQRVMLTWMQKMSEVQNRRPNTGPWEGRECWSMTTALGGAQRHEYPLHAC